MDPDKIKLDLLSANIEAFDTVMEQARIKLQRGESFGDEANIKRERSEWKGAIESYIQAIELCDQVERDLKQYADWQRLPIRSLSEDGRNAANWAAHAIAKKQQFEQLRQECQEQLRQAHVLLRDGLKLARSSHRRDRRLALDKLNAAMWLAPEMQSQIEGEIDRLQHTTPWTTIALVVLMITIGIIGTVLFLYVFNNV